MNVTSRYVAMKSVEKKEGQFNFRCLQWTLYGYEQYEKEDRYVTRHPDSLSPNLPLYLICLLYTLIKPVSGNTYGLNWRAFI